jgi:thermitase
MVKYLKLILQFKRMAKMKSIYTLLIALMTLSSVYAATNATAVPGEFIIKFKSVNHARAFYQKSSVRDLGKHEWLGVRFAPLGFMKVTTKADYNKAVTLLGSSSEIAYVEPNYIYTIPAHADKYDQAFNKYKLNPNDEFFAKLWGIHNTKNEGIDVNAMEAWKTTMGSEKVIIAVIDTGVDYTHPDLKDNMWKNVNEIPDNGIDDDENGFVDDVYGYDFANKDADPKDDHSHGTHCAGTIGAVHNKIGVAGVMRDVSIMSLKFLTARGSGSAKGAIQSIDYATKMGAHIMSNSWGGGGKSKAMAEAIEAANEKGIVFVAAAGNSGTDNDKKPHYPSNYENSNVISVAAIDINGKPASFTNFGKKTVHVAAPGVNILSTVIKGDYKSYSGTSMAAPHVSGVVGLVLSVKGLRAAPKMRELLIKTSKSYDRTGSTTASGGIIDAAAAITGQKSIPFPFQNR